MSRIARHHCQRRLGQTCGRKRRFGREKRQQLGSCPSGSRPASRKPFGPFKRVGEGKKGEISASRWNAPSPACETSWSLLSASLSANICMRTAPAWPPGSACITALPLVGIHPKGPWALQQT
eukprot:3941322-Rhodomonas_salina.2